MKIRKIIRISSYVVILIVPVLFGIIDSLYLNEVNKTGLKESVLFF